MSTEASAVERFCHGHSVGIGSLPHRDAAAAAAFSIAEFDIATVPTLPARSPAEGMIGQAVAQVPAISFAPDGSIVVDLARIEGATALEPDLSDEAFGGLRAFLHLARQVGVDGTPVKWQFVGPVTLGVELHRAGVPIAEAFEMSSEAVRRHTGAISAAISGALPSSPQLMLLDEPWLVELMNQDFPISPDRAVDLISTGMAAVPSELAVGLHCCGSVDVATMLESGPQVISLPLSEELVEYAGYLGRFIKSGGVIVWGVLPTTGPLPARPDRFWRLLSSVWCGLVERGVDASELRLRSLVSPECGLAGHQVSTARRIARLTAEIGRKVNAQAISTKLAFGA
ncbi:hypothetical protein [Ilumatobacter sp.]|uniref:hypothetical protein n=1 Tax=Ilumatobacter sp. TaxID=1967498 RepID=UPI003C66E8A8